VLLPDKPDLDWLRKQAKRRLAGLRQSTPDAQLSDAQLQLARDYGFASWRALKAHIDAATVDPLLSSALEQAEAAAPALKAAALALIARVLSARDRHQASALLERSIAIASALREPVRHILLGEAHTAAIEVSSERALALLDEFVEHPHGQYRVAMTLQRLLERGSDEAVIEYLLRSPPGIPYPYDVAGSAIHAARDRSRRAELLRRALRAAHSEIKAARPDYPYHLSSGLLEVFSDHWQVLPSTEAAATVRDLAAIITAAPDRRESYSSAGIHFSSTRQRLLFQLLGPCRQLEPQLADALVAAHPQLARAATHFPNGLPSQYTDVYTPMTDGPPRVPLEPDLEEQAESDYVSMEGAYLSVAEELRTDFDRAFTVAVGDYESDTDPRRRNAAPQVCWPSAAAFRGILYKAGIYEGVRAERHLTRIPDPALRLLSQIELAGALAGFQQAAHSIMRELPELPPSPHQGRHAGLPPDADHPFDIPTPAIVFDRPQVTPSNDAHIAPTRHPPGAPPAGGCDADFWVIENVPLRPVLSHLFEMAPGRISMPPSLEHAHYDFTLVLPREETREVLLDRMRSSVERYFGVRREQREVDAQVVTAPRGITARERPAQFGGDGGGMSFGTFEFSQPQSSSSMPDFGDLVVGSLMDLSAVPSAARRPAEEEMRIVKESFLRMLGGPGMLGALHQALTMRELCIVLESGLRQVFVDETGTTAAYEVHVGPPTAVNSEDFVRLVSEELGLVVMPARRVVEMLTVREP
jgi:hypothetical protein